MTAERAAMMRAAIVRVCRRLWERGLIAGPDGNVSVRLGPDRLLVTPSGGAKVDIAEADLLEVDLEGRVMAGAGQASSELAMHLAIYRARPDVGAVVHAHPPTATGFAVAGETLPDGVLPELICQMGAVALVPYFTPGTPAAAAAFAPYLSGHSAFLLANHGATTVGATLDEAHRRMESLEHAARILLAARLVGRVTPLTDEQRAALQAPAAPTTAFTAPPLDGGEAG
ncbi:class II aldolase/adducin family protein [Roseisolibacter agri]|uniref:Aldolase n=1 Tax=Roseisolibacter agri TaxID=2014610 RepID=A0AA37Q575_9BACT|nr:class II aldolase/adducin family protein [Roseisolibacter agri]GLC26559.1 aldolase [Roseisolibacter agri]